MLITEGSKDFVDKFAVFMLNILRHYCIIVLSVLLKMMTTYHKESSVVTESFNLIFALTWVCQFSMCLWSEGGMTSPKGAGESIHAKSAWCITNMVKFDGIGKA